MSGYNTLKSQPASPLCVGTGVPGCTPLFPQSHGSWGPTKLSDLLSQRLDLLSPFICLPRNAFTWSSLQPQTNKCMEEVFKRDHSDKAKDKKVATERSFGVEKVSCKYAFEIHREGFSLRLWLFMPPGSSAAQSARCSIHGDCRSGFLLIENMHNLSPETFTIKMNIRNRV